MSLVAGNEVEPLSDPLTTRDNGTAPGIDSAGTFSPSSPKSSFYSSWALADVGERWATVVKVEPDQLTLRRHFPWLFYRSYPLDRLRQIVNGRCKVCNDLDQSLRLFPDPNDRRRNTCITDVGFLARSKGSNCPYCRLIILAVCEFCPELNYANIQDCRLVICPYAGKTVSVSIFCIESRVYDVEFYSPIANPSIPPYLRTTREVPCFASSEKTFRFIEGCLERCIRSHSQCSPPLAKFPPTRLLYVAVAGVEQASVQQWSPHLESRKHHIPWDNLSVVFRDAIQVAYWFKIQYIWIDSLCIIQDSKTDWEIESSSMAQIYENAHFTIAAVSSPSGNVSFLNNIREHSTSVSLEEPCQGTKTKNTTLKARRSSRNWCLSSTCDGPLSKRAWACQEMVLSKRIIQYTPAEVNWHCIEECACECGLGSLPGKLSIRIEWPAYHIWHRIVEDYSKRNLTLAFDRLPGLSGVACKIRQLVSSEYLAGLWKENLAFDLIWRGWQIPSSNAFSCRSSESSEAIATPSWSWTSIRDEVQYPNYGRGNPRRFYTSYITVLEAKCSPTGKNPFGEVDGGSLTLRARAYQASLYVNDGMYCRTYLLERGGHIHEMTPDCLLSFRPGSTAGQGTIHRQVQVMNCSAGQTTAAVVLEAPEYVGSFEGTVWCIHMGRGRRYVARKRRELIEEYFLIVTDSLSTPGSFERLGLLIVEENHKPWLEGLESKVMRIV